jgi:hypothetical protein
MRTARSRRDDQVAVDDLRNLGIGNAKKILVSGCSPLGHAHRSVPPPSAMWMETRFTMMEMIIADAPASPPALIPLKNLSDLSFRA